MKSSYQTEESSYRRGLVLGFTIAEIVILIIFILLLVLASILIKKSDALKQSESKIEQLKKIQEKLSDYELLQKKYEEIAADFTLLSETVSKVFSGGTNSFDDYFNKLKVAEHNAAKVKPLEEKIAALEESQKVIDNVKAELNDANIRTDTLKDIEESLIDAVKKAVAFNKAKNEINTNDPQIALQESYHEISNLKGQLKNRQAEVEKCKGLGKGADYPPCWADENTGKAEFIFDIKIIQDGGLILKMGNPSRRDEDLKKLPIKDVILDEKIPIDSFMSTTKPLYDWSEENNCRFFVTVLDQTGTDQKEIYKKHLKAIENHFYKKLLN